MTWEKKEEQKIVEFCRKHLITSSRSRKKKPARATAITTKTTAVNLHEVVMLEKEAKMECGRVWHSIAMKITREKKMCNQIGKIYTRNILMHCSMDRVQMLSCLSCCSTSNFVGRQQRTHIKTRGVLYMLWNKNNITLNSIESKYMPSKRVLNAYTMDSITMGNLRGKRQSKSKSTSQKNSTSLFWTRLFYSFECLQSHIYFILYIFFYFLGQTLVLYRSIAAVAALHLIGTWRKEPVAVRLVGWRFCHWFFFIYPLRASGPCVRFFVYKREKDTKTIL